MFVIPEVPEVDEKQATTTDVVNEEFVGKDVNANKTQLKKDTLENNEEKSSKRDSAPVYDTKSSGVDITEENVETSKEDAKDVTMIDVSKTDEIREPAEMKKRKSSEDMSEIQTEEELNKMAKRIKSFGDSFQVGKADKSVSDKNIELATMNGVHEDLSCDKTPDKMQDDSKPELVTVKEGYSLAAPKQKVSFGEERHDNGRLDGTVSNVENTEPRKNSSKEQHTSYAHVSGALPLETEIKDKDSNVLEPKSTVKQDDYENTVASSTSTSQVDDSTRKLQTSVHLSDIPVTFDRPGDEKEPTLNYSNVSQEHETGKTTQVSAAERTQPVQNNTPSENGGKTDTANQSQSSKNSHDAENDSPWVLQLPQNGNLGPRRRNEDNRNNENYKMNEQKEENKKSEAKEKHEQILVPNVTIEQSNSLKGWDNEKQTLEEPSDGESEGHSSERVQKRRRLSEPDLSLRPLSPLMEDQESNSKLLNPSAGQSAKVKKSKSFMARGFSKMFGSKRKYKVDKELKENSYSSETENQMTQAEFDLKENHSGEEKKRKKKKKKKVEEQDGREKTSDGQSADENKRSPRKFGGIFSRGKKKEKHSHPNENK